MSLNKSLHQPETPKSKISRTKSKTRWQDVQRDSDVSFVGDLHGSLRAFRKNLYSLNLINESGNWIGNNSKLVFLGDILADRNSEGLKILQDIHRLRQEASEQGGEILLIAGNHDEYAISFLRDVPVQVRPKESESSLYKEHGIQSLSCCELEDTGVGIGEFIEYTKFGSSKKDRIKKLSKKTNLDTNTFQFNSTRNREILRNMRKSSIGRIILETICSYNICLQIDDTLAQHCPLNIKMLKLLQSFGEETINSLYQKVLRRDLLGEKTSVKKSETNLLNIIRNTFLATENRTYPTNLIFAEDLSEMGINLNIHGHNPHGGLIYVIDKTNWFVNIDYGAFISASMPDDSPFRSIAKIRSKDGIILLGKPEITHSLIRGKNDRRVFANRENIENQVKLIMNNPKFYKKKINV